MKVIGYSARRYAGATRWAIGGQATLLTCPPVTDGSFLEGTVGYRTFDGADVVVLNLHGTPKNTEWYGDEGVVALRAETLAALELDGVGVCAVNCYLGDEPSILHNALWRAGVAWLLAGAGENYGGRNRPVGADVLIKHFLRALEGKGPEGALGRAKVMAQLTAPRWTPDQREALADALEFKLLRRP